MTDNRVNTLYYTMHDSAKVKTTTSAPFEIDISIY